MANSYKDKYRGVDGRLSVMEILQKVGTTEYRESGIKKYEAFDITEVKIDGNPFRNYGTYQFIWEKTLVKSPERSADGSLSNLNSHATFLTPHLILDFSIMSIDDYRKIMLLHYGANEFTVECYDPIYNRKIKVKMYFATEEMAKLYTIAQNRLLPNGQWQEWVDIVGVNEYKVELIGTNNALDLVSVKYEYNAPLDENGLPIYPNGAPIPPQYEEDIYLGEEIVVGGNSTFPTMPPSNNYQFSHWTMLNENGEVLGTRSNGLVMTINVPITFRAEWKATSTHTLSFNYGLSDVAYTVENGIKQDILNIAVQKDESIGELPPLTETPTVPYNGENVPAYWNGAWHKTPSKAEVDEIVNSGQNYWLDRDTIIYALYDKMKFQVTYETNVNEIKIQPQYIAYDEIVYTPNLYREGYTFKGWYTDSDFKTAFSENGKMPPKTLTLYAKWERNLYTVELNPNGGEGGVSFVKVYYGDAMPKVKAPTRKDYTFNGYQDNKYTVYYNEKMESVRNWDKAYNSTLYARWIAK